MPSTTTRCSAGTSRPQADIRVGRTAVGAMRSRSAPGHLTCHGTFIPPRPEPGCCSSRYSPFSIYISLVDHQKLKAIADLKGQSIKEYVLDRALGDAPALHGLSENDAFKALTNFFKPRIEQARCGQLSGKSLDGIRREESKRAGVWPNSMPGYDLTLAAKEDLRGIWRYTFETRGAEQADKYLEQPGNGFRAIASRQAPSRSLPQLPDEVCVDRCQHHYIFWIVICRPAIIPVLHEKMDVPQRLKDSL